MQTITTETNVYSIDELKAKHPEAYEKALQNYGDINTDFAWYEFQRDDTAEQWDQRYGITYDPQKVYFDLGRSSWIAFEDIWVTDEKRLYRTLEMSHGEKCAITRQDLEFRFSTSHYGGGVMYTSLEIEDWRPDTAPDLTIDADQWFREIAQEMLYDLRNEYDYQTSEEQIYETLKINEYQFTLDGKIF